MTLLPGVRDEALRFHGQDFFLRGKWAPEVAGLPTDRHNNES